MGYLKNETNMRIINKIPITLSASISTHLSYDGVQKRNNTDFRLLLGKK